MLMSLNINTWQKSLYDNFIKTINTPIFPITTISEVDNSALTFFSYSAAFDPGKKYYYVLHDPQSMPSWLFLMKYKGQVKNELWHRDIHSGIPCNVIRNNKILLHLQTIGFIKVNIIFQVNYEIINTKYGVVLSVVMDKTYKSNDVEEFRMFLWVFPHPTIKNLVIIAVQGYTKSNYSVDIINSSIKWHVDNILQNVGERLITVIK
jgi:hypothetical protein